MARVKDITNGLGAHSVIEAVGTQESMMQCSSPTSTSTAVPHQVRRFLPELVDLIWQREIDPGKVFDLSLPLEEVAEGYRAMDERRAIKVLLWP